MTNGPTAQLDLDDVSVYIIMRHLDWLGSPDTWEVYYRHNAWHNAWHEDTWLQLPYSYPDPLNAFCAGICTARDIGPLDA